MQRRGVRLTQSAQEESALSALRPQLPSAHPAPTQAAWRSGCGSRASHAPSRRTARVSRLRTARARAGSARWCLRCPRRAPWRPRRRAQRQQRGTATPGVVGVRRAGQRRRERRAWAPGSARALRGVATGGVCAPRAKPPRRAAQADAPGAPSASIGQERVKKSAQDSPARHKTLFALPGVLPGALLAAMATGGRGFGRSYPKEFLALETQLREAAPLVQGLVAGVPHARVRAAAALSHMVDACRRVRGSARLIRARGVNAESLRARLCFR